MFSFFGGKKTVDIKREKQNVANLALGIASIMFFTMLAQIVVANVIYLIAPALLDSMVAQMFISAITMYGIAMPMSMTFFNRCEVEPIKGKKLGFGMMIGVIAICFALTYVGSIVGTVIEEMTAEMMGSVASNPVADTVSAIPLWAVLLFVVILAPCVWRDPRKLQPVLLCRYAWNGVRSNLYPYGKAETYHFLAHGREFHGQLLYLAHDGAVRRRDPAGDHRGDHRQVSRRIFHDVGVQYALRCFVLCCHPRICAAVAEN